MNNEEIHKLDMKSKDIVKDNISKIAELFPECISEGKIDFDLLKQELSKDIIEDGKERYQLTWVGKKEALVNANAPCNKTLRPVKEKSVDFDNTKNIYIEGDNLEVLKILQESYLNKIKCIYIDPPYNTGSDFIYNDKFVNKNELEESGQIDEYNNRLVSNQESNGRFHSDWISMMYSRLKLARNLLKENGVCFISIDEHEIYNLINIINEIFGCDNFDILVWRKNGKQGNTKVINRFKITHEYIAVAYKNKAKTQLGKVKLLPNWKNEYPNPDNDPRGSYKAGNISLMEEKSNPNKANYYTITTPSGKQYTREWFISKEEFNRLDNDKVMNSEGKLLGRIYYPNNGAGVPALKIFKNEEQEYYFDSIIDEMGTFTDARNELVKLFDGNDLFPTPKPVKMIEELIRVSTNDDDIIMDFFAGSSTTAHSVFKLNSEKNNNLKFILVQIPERCDGKALGYDTICEIGEERIRKAGKKIKEETNANIDNGFRVYKVDSSNMKDVYYTPTDLQQSQLNMFESNIKEDRTAEDLLTQVILNLGLTLDLSIEEKKILNNNVYFVENNSLVACFDDNIDINIVDEICKCNPLKIVFKESSFKTDSDKINVFERIKKLSNDTEINVI